MQTCLQGNHLTVVSQDVQILDVIIKCGIEVIKIVITHTMLLADFLDDRCNRRVVVLRDRGQQMVFNLIIQSTTTKSGPPRVV